MVADPGEGDGKAALTGRGPGLDADRGRPGESRYHRDGLCFLLPASVRLLPIGHVVAGILRGFPAQPGGT